MRSPRLALALGALWFGLAACAALDGTPSERVARPLPAAPAPLTRPSAGPPAAGPLVSPPPADLSRVLVGLLGATPPPSERPDDPTWTSPVAYDPPAVVGTRWQLVSDDRGRGREVRVFGVFLELGLTSLRFSLPCGQSVEGRLSLTESTLRLRVFEFVSATPGYFHCTERQDALAVVGVLRESLRHPLVWQVAEDRLWLSGGGRVFTFAPEVGRAIGRAADATPGPTPTRGATP